MRSLIIKHNSSVKGNLVNELKHLWLAKVSRKALFINFDSQPNKCPNWLPHLGTQYFQ